MIEKGSLVKLVGMEYEEGTGFNKEWQNDAVGTVIRHNKVTNINTGKSVEICSIQLLVPILSVRGNKITQISGVRSENLEEIVRVAIPTPFNRVPIIKEDTDEE